MLQMAQNVVNLRQFRKRRARRQADEAAQANRVRHGASKAERDVAAALERLEKARLDGHLLEREPVSPPAPQKPEK